MTPEIAVLVSIGRHPVSGRPRRAPTDAQALELGLRAASLGGAKLHVLHAGDPEACTLRDYLGMGVDSLRVLAVPPDADPVPALAEWLHAARPALVLAGTRAETGLSSGSVPYALAAALDGYALVPACVDLRLAERVVELRQALPEGRRRAVRAMLPVVVTVDRAAPPARQSAYARARRGRIVTDAPAGPRAAVPDYGIAQPARAHPARLRAAQSGGPVERLRAITSGPVHTARIVHASSPAEAAERIHAFLDERRLIQRAAPVGAPARTRRSRCDP